MRYMDIIVSGSNSVNYKIGNQDTHIHQDWDSNREPILTVEPGEKIQFDCRDASNGIITSDTDANDMRDESWAGHALTGPVAVNGAQVGDVLAVEIQSVEHNGWGYTLFRPGNWDEGLLPEEFEDPGFYFWHLSDKFAHFENDIKIPLAPFPGVIGVVPENNKPCSTVPPREVGGNLDIKHLVEGSTVYIPVAVDGGLLSIGDGHAAQGDGEVCLSAIEAPLTVTVKVEIKPNMKINGPQFEVPAESAAIETGPLYATTGIADNLMSATKKAILEMIEYFVIEHGLTSEQAYILSSVSVDLKINEVVNEPNYVVSAYVPKRIFPN